MKKSDIAMIILIASASVLISFAIANQLTFLKPPEAGQKVKTAEAITATVKEPDTAVFNTDALNPTVQTIVGGGQAAQ